jgi:hypothetical protein
MHQKIAPLNLAMKTALLTHGPNGVAARKHAVGDSKLDTVLSTKKRGMLAIGALTWMRFLRATPKIALLPAVT